MADIISDGTIYVALVDTIDDTSGPTVAEINAGEEITTLLTADGFVGFQGETAAIDASSLASVDNFSLDGRVSYDGMMLRLKKQDTNDDVHDDYAQKGVATHVVVRRHVDRTDVIATADVVQVFPVRTGAPKYLDPEPNSLDRYEVPLFLTGGVVLDAVVAAT